MAEITPEQAVELRRIAARRSPTVTWTKPQINAALQAIEDAIQSTSNVGGRSIKAALALAIENAAPGVFTNPQKDELFVIWCRFNVARGGIL
jgi:hypothetical protein